MSWTREKRRMVIHPRREDLIITRHLPRREILRILMVVHLMDLVQVRSKALDIPVHPLTMEINSRMIDPAPNHLEEEAAMEEAAVDIRKRGSGP